MAPPSTRLDESNALDVERTQRPLQPRLVTVLDAFSRQPKSVPLWRSFAFLTSACAIALFYLVGVGVFTRSTPRVAYALARSRYVKEVSQVKRPDDVRAFELDVIVSVYDENPETVLRHLETCCSSETCRVWLYSAFEPGVSERSHALDSTRRENHEIQDWLDVHTSFVKSGARVNNSWTGSESTAYITHIHEHYNDLADKIAFVHGHVSSWHSGKMCDIIRVGLSKVEEAGLMKSTNSRVDLDSPSVYVNINAPYPWRCISRAGFSGPFATESLRDGVYANWKKWTGEEPPDRMTWECCAQFVTTRKSLQARSSAFWKKLYDAVPSTSTEQIPWEYLWPTLVDEVGSSKRGAC